MKFHFTWYQIWWSWTCEADHFHTKSLVHCSLCEVKVILVDVKTCKLVSHFDSYINNFAGYFQKQLGPESARWKLSETSWKSDKLDEASSRRTYALNNIGLAKLPDPSFLTGAGAGAGARARAGYYGDHSRSGRLGVEVGAWTMRGATVTTSIESPDVWELLPFLNHCLWTDPTSYPRVGDPTYWFTHVHERARFRSCAHIARGGAWETSGVVHDIARTKVNWSSD